MIGTVTLNQLKEILQLNHKYKLIDCREADEFKYTHIEGFTNIPISEFETRIENELNKSDPIIIISQYENRAKMACEFLLEKKFKNACYVEQGLDRWAIDFDRKIKRY